MKRKLFAISAIFLASFGLFSCSDSKNNDEPDPKPGPEIEKELSEYDYSKLTLEEQKEKLSQEGTTAMKQLDGLKTAKSVKLLESLDAIVENLSFLSDEESAEEANVFIRAEKEPAETITKLSKYHGEYTWNEKTQDWNKKDLKDKLILNFPALKDGKENNGKIEVTAINSGVVIEGQEIPSNIEGKMFVGNEQVGSVSAIATNVNATTYAETASADVTLDDYKFLANGTKKAGANKADFLFKKGDDLIFDGVADLNANIDDLITNNNGIETFKDGNVQVSLTKNVTLSGAIDVDKIFPANDKLENTYEKIYEELRDKLREYKITKEEFESEVAKLSKETVESQVKNFNDNAVVFLVSKKDELRLADVKVLAAKYQEEDYLSRIILDKDGQPVLDEWGNAEYEYLNMTYDRYEGKLILVWKDGSSADLDTYFKGFTTVIDMWKEFAKAFNFRFQSSNEE